MTGWGSAWLLKDGATKTQANKRNEMVISLWELGWSALDGPPDAALDRLTAVTDSQQEPLKTHANPISTID